MALVNELKRLSVIILSLFSSSTLSISLILDERYMCFTMKVQNSNPYKYIASSLAWYY